MKKSLVALAVAAALPAFAQAQTSVQLTGSVDVAVESLNKDANGGQSDLQVNDGIWGGSRFAIKGSEDLGSGVKGIFALEYRGRADTGRQAQERFWHGQSWVGLDGGFGTVKLGRQYTPLHAVIDQGDMTGQSWYHSSSDLAGYASRVDNSISYATPSLGGFTLVAAYAAGEATGAGEDINKLGDTMAIGALGAWGAFNFGVGYQTVDQAEINGQDSINQLGASVSTKLGAFGAGLAYVQNEAKPVTGESDKTKGVNLSLSYQVTDSGTLYGSFTRNDYQGEDNNVDGFGLTYSHGLSKRTFVYAAAGFGKGDRADNGAVDTEAKPRRFAVGVRHFF
ncbi:MAG: porin [Lautropia sp.]|nr:porin [Lautropia sp.]